MLEPIHYASVHEHRSNAGDTPVPKTNKEILATANAAIAEGDFEGFLTLCTEDTEWTFEGDRTLKGKSAVRQWMASTYQEPPKFKVHRMIAEGDAVAALGEITLKDEAGKAVEHAYCDVWRFRDGKMAELHAFVIPRQVR
jgi:ketosteroid isomerase-like protein